MGPCLTAEERECTLIFSWISLNAQNATRQQNKISNSFKQQSDQQSESTAQNNLVSAPIQVHVCIHWSTPNDNVMLYFFYIVALDH